MIEKAIGSAVCLVSPIPVDKWHRVIGHPIRRRCYLRSYLHRIEFMDRREGGQDEEPK